MFKCLCDALCALCCRPNTGNYSIQSSKRSSFNTPRNNPKKTDGPPSENNKPTTSAPSSVSDSREVIVTDPAEYGRRRSGLAGNVANIDREILDRIEIKKIIKNEKVNNLIRQAISENEFLPSLLEGERLEDVVDAMYLKEVRANDIIIKEGVVGTKLYISFEGRFEVSIKNNVINTFSDNRVFGELAILYNAKRQATVKALTDGCLYVLDQIVYQKLTLSNEIEYRERLVNFLREVPNLNTVRNEVLLLVSYLVKREFFKTDSIIVCQGDRGDKFYIINAGSVTITKDGEGEVGKMKRGEYFGHLALLGDDIRQATVTADAPGVECYSLSREEFINHFGNIENINNILAPRRRSTFEPVSNIYKDLQLTDLKNIGILGVGGFGRVVLCQHKKNSELTFALKSLKKIDMIDQQQQEHVYNEKNIHIICQSVFIVRLYKTFRDNKYLYFLMEPCLGGDLWLLLQRQKNRRIKEIPAARFYAASVLEALAYLHERNYVYRDLKPENLLLASNGYLKLTDFGFAKPLEKLGKTYTFAGTPEYVAPEVILTRGHDRAVDYWGLGILIYEMLVGKTPFKTTDPSYMKTYYLVLRGIGSVKFPEIVSKRAEQLIKKLCKSVASERLGCQRKGPQDIRDHIWFEGFNWNQLQSCQMPAPYARTIAGNTDMRYIDRFSDDTDTPPDEISGWDTDFST